MEPLYPFRLRPIYRRYLWGGRRLESVLGKALPEGGDFAESWEVVDHREDQSVVDNGPLAGWTLKRLVRERGPDLLGRHHPQAQFPLLFKFLDCHRNLSVQVHPNDRQAAKLTPPDLGKTEAWVVLAAQPESRCYAGLKTHVGRKEFEQAISGDEIESHLHSFHPQVGDCIYIPAGTVHALGRGLLVAEIQQASDTTFRLFDWNRMGADGQPRALHVDQGLAVIDFKRGPVIPQSPEQPASGVETLVACEKFDLHRVALDAGSEHSFGGDQICRILAVLEGHLEVDGDGFGRGQTVLLPACCQITGTAPQQTSLLEMHLPSA